MPTDAKGGTQSGLVEIMLPGGVKATVPHEDLDQALSAGATLRTPATPEELQEEKYGGARGEAVAAVKGAMDTATMGGSTALMQELAVARGGQQERARQGEELHAIEQQNPISSILGQVAPLALMPEAGESAIMSGEGALAKVANKYVPKFAEGVAQQYLIDQGHGMSEDMITSDHNFTAQSYYSHIAPTDLLLGGLLNVGVSAGLSKLGKLMTPETKILGAEGKHALADAAISDELTKATQMAGRTSTEASQMYSGMTDIAQQAAAASPAQRGLVDEFAQSYIKAQSGGSVDVEKALNRILAQKVDRFASSERLLDRTAKEAVGHSDDLFKGLNTMNELQFSLKDSQVQKLVDSTRFVEQIDAANTLRVEATKLVDSMADNVDVRGPDVRKIYQTLGKLDGETRNAIRAASEAEGTRAAERAMREASAKVYIALDDTKRVVGRAAKFGLEGKDGSAAMAEHLYEQFFRPLLENDGVWGSDLAKMQRETNASFSEGFAATRRYQQMVGQVLETPGGKKVYSTERARLRSIFSELEHSTGPDDYQGLKAEVMQRVIDNTRSRAQSMIDTMDLSASEVARLKSTVESANKLESTLKRAHGEASEARTVKELQAREMAGGSGGIVKTLTGVVTSPTHTLEILGGLKKAEDAVRKVISGEAKAVVNGTKVVPTIKAITDADRKATIAAMKDIRELAQRPDLLQARIDPLASGIANVAPKIATGVATTAARAIMHLATKIPPPLPAKFLDPEPRWADSDVEDFGRLLGVAKRPLTVFERMQGATLHNDDRILMEQSFPELMTQMRLALVKEYKDANEKGQLKKMTQQEKEMISVMLGVPLDSTQSPEFTAAMQKAAMSDPNAQGAIGAQSLGGGRPRKIDTKMAEELQTSTEKISGS